MLAELRMKVEADGQEFGYYQSSNLQGVLMEQIDGAYARRLHEQGLKPYSQYLFRGEDKNQEWVVKTFTPEAYREIVLPLMEGDFTEFVLEKKGIHVKILGKELRTVPKQELLGEFYSAPAGAAAGDKKLAFEFVSPTAFRSNSKYVIMPDMKYIFQSLMNKYSAACTDMDMYDSETLMQLTDHTEIIRYQLRSVSFPLEGVRIPSFMGKMTVQVEGTDTMARYARLLARFGEYSGVGIKTAMGMGGFRIAEGRRGDDRQKR